MKLFEDEFDANKNLLPQDGTVNYYGAVFNPTEANFFFEQLLHTIDWQRDIAIIFGKRIETKRKVAWYGDLPFNYTYSNNTKVALTWSESLLKIKEKIESLTGESFNSCLLNLYHDGTEGMSWHSDGEKDLTKHGAIASVSFGAKRKFCFKHKQSKVKIDIPLAHGSLLVMKDETQSYWQHRLPPTKKVVNPRINLTFRTIENQNE